MVRFPFTVADMPAALRADAMVVGQVAARSLQSDPRVSYCMYVPASHYAAVTTQSESTREPLTLIVTVHGTERRAEQGRDLLAPFAEAHRCAVLAPLFPCSLDTAFDLDNYKTLRRGDTRFDHLLLDMLDEVAAFWPGIDTERVLLMGFSGGGQFSHRFLLMHPERVRAVSIGAPGRPTRLDPGLAWPQGVKDVEEVLGRRIDHAAIREVQAVQLVIGEKDVGIAGAGLIEWLEEHNDTGQSGGKGSKLQAVNIGRRKMLELVKEDLESCGVSAQLDIVPGAAHVVADVVPTVCRFWEAVLRKDSG